MVLLTLDLIRKKAEHHSGLLADLKELSLHQLNLTLLSNVLSQHTPALQILYLHNNLLSSTCFQQLHRCKSLEYLNLTLNNIQEVTTHISSLEKINKLDLTLNFISIERMVESVNNMKQCIFLTELYLTGNPCTTFTHYRFYVIHHLQRIQRLDGKDVTRTERLQARAIISQITNELDIAIQIERHKEQTDTTDSNQLGNTSGSSNGTSTYTPESRLQQYEQQVALEKKKAEEEKQQMSGFTAVDEWSAAREKLNRKVLTSDLDTDTLPTQRNIGKYAFTLTEEEHKGMLILEVELPKYLDTSLLDVDIHPLWLQIMIKHQLLLVHLPAEIRVNGSVIQRITGNGHLLVKMKTVKGPLNLRNAKTQTHRDMITTTTQPSAQTTKTKQSGNTQSNVSNVPDYKTIVKQKEREEKEEQQNNSKENVIGEQLKELSAKRSLLLEEEMRNRRQQQQQQTSVTAVPDDDDVPPLI